MDSYSQESSPEAFIETQLTPRSKVAKLLADIDNASSPSSSPRSNRALHPLPNTKPEQLPHSAESDDVTTDSDEDVRRPLGKAARRMLASRTAGSPRQPRLNSSSPVAARSPSRSASEDEGLFVSPVKSTSMSDEELPSLSFKNNNRFAQLVAEKRAERKARAQAQRQQETNDDDQQTSSDLEDMVDRSDSHEVDPSVEQLLSDAVRPTRKASKKAIQDMARETQRMAREQALAHEMKVKKKFTTADLLSRFKYYKKPNEVADVTEETATSSAPNSDTTQVEIDPLTETPPSSPPDLGGDDKTQTTAPTLNSAQTGQRIDIQEDGVDEDLPELDMLRATGNLKPQPTEHIADMEQHVDGPSLIMTTLKASHKSDLSDDELEILQPLPKHLAVFDRAKTSRKAGPDNSCKAIHTLRHLSHLGAYDAVAPKKGSRPSVSHNLLEARLRRKAKAQARAMELDRIAELEAKGISVQTAEDREKEAEVFENMLEKARQDALDLRRMEKSARAENDDNERAMDASDDESEDDEYLASGSEDDAAADEDDEASEDETAGNLVNIAAEEVDDSENDESDPDEDVPLDDPLDEFLGLGEHVNKTYHESQDLASDSQMRERRPRRIRIIEDDDDGDDRDHMSHDLNTPVAKPMPKLHSSTASQEDPFAIFDVNKGDGRAMLMSPTQAFNATMQTPTQVSQSYFGGFNDREPPKFANVYQSSQLSGKDQNQSQFDRDVSIIPGSQGIENQNIDLTWEAQPPETPQMQKMQDLPLLIDTPGWAPTQDQGLATPSSVGLQRQDTISSIFDHETQSTVRIRVSESPAPLVTNKRGRLVRRQNQNADTTGADQVHANTKSVIAGDSNAFKRMERLRKADLTAAEKAGALEEMKGMMDDQAEESDDEYAGLGGDDYIAPENEQDKDMIDSSHIDVDERGIAAHFAERQRRQDEAETSKLYKDLTTGALRRKQANLFGLDDDEDEMAIRRRQIKQQAEAKKRKLLLQDDNIAGLAEGKQSVKKDAFLKAIADDDDEQDDLSDHFDGDELENSQQVRDESRAQLQDPALQEISSNKRGPSDDYDHAENRPPAKMRRTQPSGAFKRPASMLEVKESVSFLLDDPNAMWAASTTVAVEVEELGSDAGDEDEDYANDSPDAAILEESRRVNDGGFAETRTTSSSMLPPRLPASQRRTAASKPAVVDRISLKRAESSSSDSSGRSAWASSTTSGFKVPSLLRRATTNLNMTTNERGVSTPNLSREGSGVKMGGSKKSSLAYQARAEERMAIIEAGVRRRQENTAKIAQLRRHSTADALLSRGLGGRFE